MTYQYFDKARVRSSTNAFEEIVEFYKQLTMKNTTVWLLSLILRPRLNSRDHTLLHKNLKIFWSTE